MARVKAKPVYAGGFLLLPKALLNCPKFGALSPSGIKLLIDLGGLYSGKNNGDLSAAWKVMRPKGWHSESTLNKAKKELLAAGFIAETRKGTFAQFVQLVRYHLATIEPAPKAGHRAAWFSGGRMGQVATSRRE